ncbi:cobalamin-binding protein [Nocardiopsis gilva YIM 90087]|uniref:Cobalamin-binding protein n=1 Tax=Nocardiopsis gilva YIM 90087 TaxID=1235441 RepID=A0A223S5B6_9ACTN|nr:helical backbone metal receptor [Nocardiopsis gilva]ASU83267.1 cobalamin-binding protein [Nocardiopsis gilva YIM 90087]
MIDDTGAAVTLAAPVRRVVSLVPSLTEAVALTAPDLLVGATDWCSHPADLDVVRVRGTKNPHVERVIGLRPDLVLANFEENRPADLDALRAAGIPVWVTVIRTLPEALDSLERMLAACGLAPPPWLEEARTAWSDLLDAPPPPRWRAIVPVWRRPWMVLGHGTFAGDLLARLGVANLYADDAERYPKIPLAELTGTDADLVVLPDEPYAFTATDGPESFPDLPAALVSGRHLTWYGPSLAEAREVLTREISSAQRPN